MNRMRLARPTDRAPVRWGRCAWCAIQLSGLRRYWARGCRECAPRLYGSAGIYLSAGSPPALFRSRAGQVEPLPLLRILRWGAPMTGEAERHTAAGRSPAARGGRP